MSLFSRIFKKAINPFSPFMAMKNTMSAAKSGDWKGALMNSMGGFVPGAITPADMMQAKQQEAQANAPQQPQTEEMGGGGGFAPQPFGQPPGMQPTGEGVRGIPMFGQAGGMPRGGGFMGGQPPTTPGGPGGYTANAKDAGDPGFDYEAAKALRGTPKFTQALQAQLEGAMRKRRMAG